jgi:hypothetical protein
MFGLRAGRNAEVTIGYADTAQTAYAIGFSIIAKDSRFSCHCETDGLYALPWSTNP